MLLVGERRVAPKLVLFDKDGTLIAFRKLWRAWFEGLWQTLEQILPLDAGARSGVAESLGVNLETGEWDKAGPLTLAATREVAVIIASQLYRYLGLDWLRATEAVENANERASASLPMDELLEPIGDVQGLLARLKDEGIALALVTADDRRPTEEALRHLGWLEFFAHVSCGDDGLPVKPAPDMALEACRRVGVDPRDAMLVGDSVLDMVMARRAGIGLAVAVTSGAMDEEHLAPYADLVLDNIHEIRVIDEEKA